MKNTVLNPSLKKRKELLHEVAKTDPSWKVRMFFAVFLFICAPVILVSVGILLILNPTTGTGIFAFSCWAVMMACIPFIAASAIKNRAKYKCAQPFSSYANGTLFLGEEDLQYVFWQVGPTEPAAYSSPRAVYHDEDKFVYQINRDCISKLTIDENGVCRIIGKGQMILPEGVELPKSEINGISKDFSFVLAFAEENAEQAILDWKNNE